MGVSTALQGSLKSQPQEEQVKQVVIDLVFILSSLSLYCRVVNDYAIRSGQYVNRPVVHPATSLI